MAELHVDRKGRRRGVWVWIVLLIALSVLVWYFFLRDRRGPAELVPAATGSVENVNEVRAAG